MMKSIIRRLLGFTLSTIVSVDAIWKLSPHSRSGFFRYLFFARSDLIERRIVEKSDSDGVLSGPFQGMRYAKFSFGSALWPKYLGTYENELKDAFEYAKQKKYAIALDVGCAEGYYAVGIATWSNVESVIAYDIADEARDACRELSRQNSVQEKLAIRSFCSEKDLAQCEGKPSLLICDCEGFENTLLTSETAAWLLSTDLIVECHDHLVENTGRNLLRIFEKTHDCVFIDAVSAESKEKNLELLLNEPSKEIRLRLVDEGRPSGMQWLFAKAKGYV